MLALPPTETTRLHQVAAVSKFRFKLLVHRTRRVEIHLTREQCMV
jgi:hypothetical protein